MRDGQGIKLDFQRFVDAQEPILASVLSELGAGKKRTHWMWFIFPQISGLGASWNAKRFALQSVKEAQSYINHPILGPRLELCTELVLQHANMPIGAIFEFPDDLKFHSSMSLFAHATSQQLCFQRAITAFFRGKFDEKTLALI